MWYVIATAGSNLVFTANQDVCVAVETIGNQPLFVLGGSALITYLCTPQFYAELTGHDTLVLMTVCS